MKFTSVKNILATAQKNKQRGVMKMNGGFIVTFSFTGEDCAPDTIEYDSSPEIISILRTESTSYVNCESIQSINVYK